MKLTGKQARYLRGLGHHLQAIVMIGKDELTDRVVAATDEALTSHELIKVKLQDGCLSDRREIASELAQATSSNVAQVLGRTFLLYRRHPENPQISLPKP
ncbi:MAG: ribosome assembly RNA-binding protein YhbY [Desulfuromonadales bacterium]|nr:ribosome assembly RNA-binding protein YhbY [Desulfuromonadales bacterium]